LLCVAVYAYTTATRHCNTYGTWFTVYTELVEYHVLQWLKCTLVFKYPPAARDWGSVHNHGMVSTSHLPPPPRRKTITIHTLQSLTYFYSLDTEDTVEEPTQERERQRERESEKASEREQKKGREKARGSARARARSRARSRANARESKCEREQMRERANARESKCEREKE